MCHTCTWYITKIKLWACNKSTFKISFRNFKRQNTSKLTFWHLIVQAWETYFTMMVVSRWWGKKIMAVKCFTSVLISWWASYHLPKMPFSFLPLKFCFLGSICHSVPISKLKFTYKIIGKGGISTSEKNNKYYKPKFFPSLFVRFHDI